MKKVVITGATGFIGRHCLTSLVAKGYDVHAICKSSHADSSAGVEWHATNLLDPSSVESLFATVRPSHLLHFAWCTTPGEYWTSRENLHWVQASLNIVQSFAAFGGQRVVMAGTSAEYLWNSEHYSEQGTPLEPATLYGTSKHALHLMVDAFCKQASVSNAWGRIFFLYGPYEHPQRLVASVIYSLLRGEPARCSEGNQVRDFLYVEDVADAFTSVLDAEATGAINIGSGKATMVREIVDSIGRILNRRPLIQFGALPRPDNDPPSVVADVRKLERIGWSPRWTLEAGLTRTIDWWKRELRIS